MNAQIIRTNALVALMAFSVPLPADTVRLSEPVTVTAEYEIFGEPMESTEPGISLTEALNRGDELKGQEIRLTTRVSKVCQKKGCFFIAHEDALMARVTFADYSFFVPTDSAGKPVTLIGTLIRQELSVEQADHYSEDLGEASSAQQPTVEYAIVATSVLLPRS